MDCRCLGHGIAAVFCGNVVFANFEKRQEPTTSLGYNLIGAICGELLEYSSMALGTKNLYLLALVLYILAFLVHGREKGITWGRK